MTKVTYSIGKQIMMICSFIIIMGISCTQDTKPSDLITKEKMSIILKDVHKAEASLQLFKSNERDSMARLYYSHIFRIHEIDEKEFYQSLEYYTKSPKELQEVYETTEKLLEGKKGKVEKDEKPK